MTNTRYSTPRRKGREERRDHEAEDRQAEGEHPPRLHDRDERPVVGAGARSATTRL